MSKASIDTLWQKQIVGVLQDFIRTPNKSPAFDADWIAHGHMHNAVHRLANWCRQQTSIAGLSVEIIELAGRTPTLARTIHEGS